MKHPLRVGQVFKCHRFDRLAGVLRYDDEGKPFVDLTLLSVLDKHESGKTTASWTEEKAGGWKRENNQEFDLKPPISFADVKFKVIETDFRGGDGPHDTFPDGHYVVARQVDGDTTVWFYQSGCFRGMVKPDEVIWLSGPEDVEGSWVKKNEYVVP